MIKRITLFFFILTAISFAAQAQPKGNIMALKVGIITERIELTPDQAKSFWPIYDEYTEKKRALVRSARSEMRKSNGEEISDQERLASQDEILELKEKELELTKSYRDKLLKVISVKQYAGLQAAEEHFNKLLLEELKKRRN